MLINQFSSLQWVLRIEDGKGVGGGESRSRFTENIMILSQFTKNKIGISRFTEKRDTVVFH